METNDERKELYERKELIEQLNNVSSQFITSAQNVNEVNGYIKCDIELLKKFYDSYEVCCNILYEIFINASAGDPYYYETYSKIPLTHLYGMSDRLYNILTRCGFIFLGEMALVRDADIKLLKNLGDKAFKELCALMDLYDISFGHENTLRDYIRSFTVGDKVIYDGKEFVIISINEPLTKSRLWPVVVVGYEDTPSYGIVEFRKACDILKIHRI